MSGEALHDATVPAVLENDVTVPAVLENDISVPAVLDNDATVPAVDEIWWCESWMVLNNDGEKIIYFETTDFL